MRTLFALAMVLCGAPIHRLAPVGQAWEAARPVVSEPLDINTATPAQLRALPGMGDAYVRRIVEGRPYTAKNQLLTRGILPPAAYDRIRDQIVARRAARP